MTPGLWVCLGYCALAAAFYAPLLSGLRTFPPGDFTDYFLPFNLFQRGELLAGRLPVWNPYAFAGHPFLADVQAAVFYPISNLLLALTLPWSDPTARLYWLQVEAMIHVVLAGCFTYLLARELTQNRAAAFLAGCCFAFSGYLTGYPPLQLAVLRTAIWLPLVLWLLLRAFRQPARWRWWVAAALIYAVAFLAGHPQTFLFLSYAVAGWLLVLLIDLFRNRRLPSGRLPAYALQIASRIAIFYGLFLGMSAAQLWPSLELVGLSVRANVDYAFVSGGFPLRDTWQMLLPGILSQFSPLYVGLIPLGLAVLGGVTTFVLPNPRTPHGFGARAGGRYFAILAGLALLVSYGNHGFLYPVFYRWAPGWGMFRDQERAAYLVAFGLSLLAGYGLAAFAALSSRRRQLIGLAYAAVVAAGLIGMSLSVRTAINAAALRGIALGLIILVACVRWRWWQARATPRWLWLITALVLADLFAANITTNLAPRQPLPSAEAVAMRATLLERGRSPGRGSVPERVHNEGVLPEDAGMFVGIEGVSGSSPLKLARYAVLLSDFPRDRLWQLTGVRYVLSRQPVLYVPSQRVAEFAGPAGPSFLYQVEAPNPRAWVVNTVRTVEDAQALPLLGDASFDPAQTALLPPFPPLGMEDGVLALPGTNQILLERRAPNVLRVNVDSEYGGLLVVSENWLPGWRATAQQAGQPAGMQLRRDIPVVRADLTFLGVPVRPGQSTIELTYAPDSVRFGLAVSGMTLLLMGGVALVARRRAANSDPQPPVIKTPRLWVGIVLGCLLLLAIWGALYIVSTRQGSASAAGERESHAVAALFTRYSAGWPAGLVRVAQTGLDSDMWRAYTGSAERLAFAADTGSAAREIGALGEQGVQRVVVAITDDPAGGGVMLRELAQSFALVADTPVGGWRVQVYDRPPAYVRPLDISFAAGVRLSGAAIPVTQVRGGDVVPIYLQWDRAPRGSEQDVSGELDGAEKLTLQLLDAHGKLVAQTDELLGGAVLRSSGAPIVGYHLALPRFLAPGPYRLIVALYDPARPAAPRLLTTTGADHVELATLAAP
jgi:hypothetical protein